ncbi:MAG TPA: hypothetical protein VER17_05575 [Tepidisphaeraceae bacterium]|nr:hypothetical protein [Tepidisphaeraceae bacterium]
MRHRTRHVIAVMVVATALCADRSARAEVVAASPQHPRTADARGFARTFASRITSSLQQAVAPVQMRPARSSERSVAPPVIIGETASGVRSAFSPFQFRLPPPAF